MTNCLVSAWKKKQSWDFVFCKVSVDTYIPVRCPTCELQTKSINLLVRTTSPKNLHLDCFTWIIDWHRSPYITHCLLWTLKLGVGRSSSWEVHMAIAGINCWTAVPENNKSLPAKELAGNYFSWRRVCEKFSVKNLANTSSSAESTEVDALMTNNMQVTAVGRVMGVKRRLQLTTATESLQATFESADVKHKTPVWSWVQPETDLSMPQSVSSCACSNSLFACSQHTSLQWSLLFGLLLAMIMLNRLHQTCSFSPQPLRPIFFISFPDNYRTGRKSH